MRAQGTGTIDLKRALVTPTPVAVQTWPEALGTGSLDAARGSVRLQEGTSVLQGEQDIFGAAFSAPLSSARSLTGTA